MKPLYAFLCADPVPFIPQCLGRYTVYNASAPLPLGRLPPNFENGTDAQNMTRYVYREVLPSPRSVPSNVRCSVFSAPLCPLLVLHIFTANPSRPASL